MSIFSPPLESEEDLEQCHKALSFILTDEEAFNRVLKSIFDTIDLDENGTIETSELERFISCLSSKMHVSTPTSQQIQFIFSHLDLNSDNVVQKEELAIFVKHMLQERVRYCILKLDQTRKTTRNIK
uniref:EF-hand domain-containing protein n=1 Tax=Polytomella parva TaxID=51329 RepID=A0A7S0YSG9_9CHLO|mmetsp:Transcript_34931/g.62802  ORF Transcript_34931/g.62802 Transcript_34931/m.62802 type:complete len:127 (+) Transcript_34931:296-676(+)